MKLHLPLSLRTSLLAATCLLAAGATHAADSGALGDAWGNTIYIGDSITHGFNVQPYRWYLFKNLVDIGVTQQEVGIQPGYYHSSIPAAAKDLVYGTQSFANLHAAQSSISANQVGDGDTTSTQLDGSSLSDWLGLNGDYDGTYQVHSADGSAATPDTAFIMIGTNDIFNATGAGYLNSTTLADHTEAMKTYLGNMITALREANPDVRIVINSIPTWSEERAVNANGKPENWKALSDLNAALKEWAEEEQGVTFLDINKGIVDVANTAEPGAGVATLFKVNASSTETQHPNAQGNLIIAGNVAQQLGYAGRTAGQARMEASAFSHQATDILAAEATTTSGTINLSENGGLELAAAATLKASWAAEDDLTAGFTVDFTFGQNAEGSSFGNGGTDGWLTDQHFSLSVGDGTYAGTLKVNEAYIQWGDTILYSMDTSTLTDSLRVAYVYGNAKEGLESGFYVWMGDMLIGEALDSSGTTNGLELANGSGSTLNLTNLSMTDGAAAPWSELYFAADSPLISPLVGNGLETETKTLTNITIGNGETTAVRNQSGIASGTNAVITVDGGSTSTDWLVASQGSYEGDVDITLGGTFTKNREGKYNVAQYQGTLDGNITLTIADSFKMSTESTHPTWGAFVGTDGATVQGNITMVFSSGGLTVVGQNDYAIAGAIGSYRVLGAIDIIVNAGEFTGNIYGGLPTGNRNDYFSDGTHVTINGGTIHGNIYGFGVNGTINQGGSSVTIGGDATIDGNLISAGGTGGHIAGGTLLKVQHVREDSAFAAYTGTLSGNNGSNLSSGTRVLQFDDVVLDAFGGTLENFDNMRLTGNSSIGLSALGTTADNSVKHISVEGGSHLTFTGGTHSVRVENQGNVTIEESATLTLNATDDGNLSGTYNIHGGTLNVTGYNKLDNAFVITSGTLANVDGTDLSGGVTVNATGEVALVGVELENISSLTAQEGGRVSLTLDDAALALTAANQSTGNAALMLGAGGSLNVNSLTLNLDSTLSSSGLTSATGQLLVNEGALNAGSVTINLSGEGSEGYRLLFSGISSSGGYSYVDYTRYASATMDNTDSFGNGNSGTNYAIANLAAKEKNLNEGNLVVTTNGGSMSTEFLVAHNQSWTGDIVVELGGTLTKATADGYNVAQYQGTLTGSITQIITEGFKIVADAEGTAASVGAFIGASCNKVTDDVTMEFSSQDLAVTTARNGYAIKGAENTTVGGSTNITVNKGSFTGGVTGAYGGSVGDGTHVTINGGSITGNVTGASNSSTITNGTHVAITGGTITGNVRGTDTATINEGGNIQVEVSGGSISGNVTGAYASRVMGDVSVTVTGGTISQDVSGAMLNTPNETNVANGTVNGNTHVTISGGTVSGSVYGGNSYTAVGAIKGSTAVTVTGGATIKGNVYAGSKAGTIGGDTTLTVKDVTTGNAFASYSGTLDGGSDTGVEGTRTLCFEHVRLNAFDATLQNFDAVAVTAQSAITLTGLGGASDLSVDEGSRLTLNLSDALKLDNAAFSLGAESLSEATSLLTLSDAALSVGTLTLNLSAEICAYITAAPATMALTDAATAPATHELLVAVGDLGADKVVVNMAEGYSNYAISAQLSYNAEDGNSYLSLSAVSIPEPTTATLSLLALAGLAARRRRK